MYISTYTRTRIPQIEYSCMYACTGMPQMYHKEMTYVCVT